MSRYSLTICGAVLSLLGPLHAAIIITVEGPHVTSSQVAGALTANFNSATAGPATSYVAAGLGTYTGDLSVRVSDQYGGAEGTNYLSVDQSGEMILTLLSPAAYFGMWWSAGDSQNFLDFYLGSTLLGTFATSNLLTVVDSGHFGKPGTSENPSEPYAYANFYGTAGTTFDRVVFRNLASTNFETDNHSFLATEAAQTGEPVAQIDTVPEPSQSALTGLALVGLTWLTRRQRRS